MKQHTSDPIKKDAMQFILFFGIVSALGDITYEGARGVYGAYLQGLGATAFAVGLISGIAEFLTYLLRFISGFIADKTKKYWIITILGYGLLISVPLLGYVSIWQMAIIFIFMERIGKGLRSPPRDAMLSYATAKVGHGKGFGIHEALDQIGAIVGPLIFTFAYNLQNNYQIGFKFMWIPYAGLMIFILLTYKKYTDPKAIFTEKIEISSNLDNKPSETSSNSPKSESSNAKKPLPKLFFYYSLFILFSTMGFIGFPLLGFYMSDNAIVSPQYIPTLYAVAMGIDALFALIIGTLFDKKGMKVLYLIPILTAFMIFFAFSLNLTLLIIGIIIWGCVMAIHETIIRAAVAKMTTSEIRSRAYSIFYTIYGLSFLFGNTLLGYIIGVSITSVIIYVVACELISVFMLIFILKKQNPQ